MANHFEEASQLFFICQTLTVRSLLLQNVEDQKLRSNGSILWKEVRMWKVPSNSMLKLPYGIVQANKGWFTSYHQWFDVFNHTRINSQENHHLTILPSHCLTTSYPYTCLGLRLLTVIYLRSRSENCNEVLDLFLVISLKFSSNCLFSWHHETSSYHLAWLYLIIFTEPPQPLTMLLWRNLVEKRTPVASVCQRKVV